MRVSVFLMFALCANLVHAQNETNPLLPLETLCEDGIDTHDPAYQHATIMGVVLYDFRLSDCDQSGNPYEMKMKQQVTAIDTSADTLTFYIQMAKNCCAGSQALVDVNGQTWNMIVKDQMDGCGECLCYCCFSATLKVSHTGQPIPSILLLNGDTVNTARFR